MNLKVVLCFVLVISFNTLVDMKEFCYGFKENGNQISYTYRRVYQLPLETISRHEVIIDGHCWSLEFNEKEKSLKFLGTESEECPFFDGKYVMAAHARLGTEPTWKNGVALLFDNKNRRDVAIGTIPGDDYESYRSLSEYRFNEKNTITSSGDFLSKAIIAFSEDFESGRSKLIIVDKNGTKYEANGFFVKQEGKQLIFDKTNDISWVTAINSIDSPHKLMSALPIWSDSHDIYILMLLFADESRVRWCWIDGKVWDGTRCGQNALTLVDCTDFIVTTSSSTTEENEKDLGSGFLMLFIFIVVAAVIIILLIGLIVFCCVKNKRSDEKTEASTSRFGTQVSGQPSRSKISNASNLSKTSSFSKQFAAAPQTGAKSSVKSSVKS